PGNVAWARGTGSTAAADGYGSRVGIVRSAVRDCSRCDSGGIAPFSAERRGAGNVAGNDDSIGIVAIRVNPYPCATGTIARGAGVTMLVKTQLLVLHEIRDALGVSA